MTIIKNKQFLITTFISLFITCSIGACQENQVKMTPQEMLFLGVDELSKKALDLVQQALHNGVNPDIQDNDGDTALILAVDYGNKEMAKLLLDANANPDIKDNNGNTALIMAVVYGNKEIVKLLLDANANPDIKDNNGNTALIVAASIGNKEIVKLLLDANANPDIQDNYSNTALILAVSYRNKEIVKLLLDANADLDIKNNKNKTALDIAREKGFHVIVEMINSEANKRKEHKEFIQKEVGEYLIPVLADLVAEYVVTCPKKSNLKRKLT